MPVKKTTKKPAAKKPAPKKTSKAPAKKAPVADSSKMSVQPRELLEKKAIEKGENIESLITRRDIEVRSVDEIMGIRQKVDFHKKPIIPGVFDLLIPPGTPRKLILKLAKEYPVELVRRDDIFVPVGVSDVERDLLAIRGDKKTIQKMEKVLMKEIDAYINGQDARLHNYAKPVKLDGIGSAAKPAAKPVKAKVKAKAVKAKAKK
jgi:hypothetical protein